MTPVEPVPGRCSACGQRAAKRGNRWFHVSLPCQLRLRGVGEFLPDPVVFCAEESEAAA